MGMSENSEEIRLRFRDICKDLNMDSATIDVAWDSFESVLQHFTLEGDLLHWLACAVYVACRQAITPTVGQTGSIIKGNCISLTRLLRHCKISIQQFLNKSKSWAGMTNMPADFRKKIDVLEKNVTVSLCIFRKYHIIFNEIFQNPVDEQPKQHKSRKQRNVPCTPWKIFEFIWSLFVCIKGEFASCSDDLVTSYHLLLACMDLAFNNALLADRRDLLNPQFEGLPSNWNSSDYVKPKNPICIIDVLCNKFDGLVKEAKWLKEYSFKQSMKNIFDNKILQGDPTNFTGLFDQQNFDTNLKSVIKVYEVYVLNIGELDEKIYLAEYRRMQLLFKQHIHKLSCSAVYDINSDGNYNPITGMREENKSTEKPDGHIDENDLPDNLTARKYLKSKDQEKNSQLTSATQCVVRLQTLLNGCLPEPSEGLLKRFNTCKTNPIENVKQIIEELGQKFVESYSAQQNDQTIDFANRRLLLSQILYWKLLENVVEDELIIHPEINLQELLENSNLHECIFAVSIEIVIYAYNSQKKFPWILNALDLKGFYFYRVIEIIVRNKDHLPRDVVQHLNSIEEQILQHIAWKSDSPLWASIKKSGMPVPNCEDSSLPNQLENGLEEMSNNNSTPSTSVPQSPISSVTEQFQSPVPCNIKKKLFGDTAKVKPGQSLLQNKTVVLLTVDGGNQKYIPVHDMGDVNPPNTPQPAPETPTTHLKPKRQGSLALFFRKFYRLTCSKLSMLLNHLNINDINLKRKIFTCFEHTIIENTELMKDRHLDQILMCSIYVVLKVSQNEKTFSEIMHCYRLQPQYQSHVYRSVLISKRPVNNENSEKNSMTVDTPVHRVNPSEMIGSSTTYGEEERGDLIKFYNSVYIKKEKDFAIKFITNNTSETLHLSPLPVTRPLAYLSPKRRVTDSFYVRTFNPTNISPPQVRQYSYLFSLSPSKDLKNINRIINSRVGKRLLNDENDEDVTPIKKAHMNRKLQDLIEDRLEQTKE